MKKVLFVIFMFLFVLGCSSQQNPGNISISSKCGIENCHGLDIKCGSNVPEACTMEYMLGDFCRQFAECKVINGNCRFVETANFTECKACVDECAKIGDGNDAFACENDCRKKF